MVGSGDVSASRSRPDLDERTDNETVHASRRATATRMTASRPTWMRIDLDFADHPKIMRLRQHNQHAAIALWIEGLAYSGRHLTDGWIPDPWPRQQGYRPAHPKALVDVGLWHPLEITDDGGWLINDYAQYQVTRQEWDRHIERQRTKARKRWAT